MMESRDEWIKKRAYALWEQEGYPSGRDTVHWEQAHKERIALEKTTSPRRKAATPVVDTKPKVKRKTAAAAATIDVMKKTLKRAPKKSGDVKA